MPENRSTNRISPTPRGRLGASWEAKVHANYLHRQGHRPLWDIAPHQSRHRRLNDQSRRPTQLWKYSFGERSGRWARGTDFTWSIFRASPTLYSLSGALPFSATVIF